MRIGLNLLYLLPGHVGGTQTYATELMTALAALQTSDAYTVYLNEEARDLPLPAGFERVVCPVRAVRRSARYAYEQFRLPHLLRQHRIDLVHSLGYVCPLRVPCRNVVTICDLNYIALVNAISRSKRVVLGRFVSHSARRSDHIVTISEFSRRQIMRHLGIDGAKVTTTHLGPCARHESGSADLRRQVLQEYGIGKPYLIAFSSLLLHKNIPRLLEAFASACRDLPHQLVLVGHLPVGLNIETDIARAGITDRVTITGYVPGSHIMPLLEQAELFVFPSLYEGFGLPLLDAQQAGVAVACSNAASLPEVAGEGALFFDPTSVPEMAAVLQRCLQDQALRHDLAVKGRANIARFSWERTARETLAVYHAQMGMLKHAAGHNLRGDGV